MILIRNAITGQIHEMETPFDAKIFMWGRSVELYQFAVIRWQSFEDTDCDKMAAQVGREIAQGGKGGAD